MQITTATRLGCALALHASLKSGPLQWGREGEGGGTVGLMDLRCPTAGAISSRAGPGRLTAGANREGRGSEEDLESLAGFTLLAFTLHQPLGKAGCGASEMLQILMPHHVRCSSLVSAGSRGPAWLHLIRGYRAVGCPEGAHLPTSAQLWLDLAP